MSANEIELTFIRCQNCKSLMPSTAVVCGMCGFQRGESQDTKSKQRLRQQSDTSLSESVTENDSANVNRLSSESNVQNNIEPRVAEHLKSEMKESPLKRDYLNFGKKRPDEAIFSKVSQQEVKGSSVEEFDDDSDDYEDDVDTDETAGSFQDREVASSRDADDRNLEVRPKKRRRRRKKKPNFQAEVQESQENQTTIAPQNLYKTQPIYKAPVAVEDEESFSVPHKERIEEEFVSRKSFDNKILPPRDVPRPDEYRKVEEVRVSQVKPVERNMDNKVRNEDLEGKLLGWLINYSTNNRGTAFELRVGRRFIGRQALRQDDLIIQDSALSTPHSLLHVEKGQIFIQDLMSENGTFVKSANSNDFVRKDSSTKLMHGDVLRLGSYELIVCLVPNH